jgi:hypothetical protein
MDFQKSRLLSELPLTLSRVCARRLNDRALHYFSTAVGIPRTVILQPHVEYSVLQHTADYSGRAAWWPCGEVDVSIHIFLTSTLVGYEWSALRSGCFTTGERAPGTHRIGGWMDPRAGLDDVEKRKFLALPGLNSHPSVVQPVASRYTDCATPAPNTHLNGQKIPLARC